MLNNKEYRIGIDARLSGQQHAGIGRYTENLIRNLIPLAKKEKAQFKFVVFFFDQNQAKNVMGDLCNDKTVEVVVTNIPHYGFKEQTVLNQIYKKAKLDLLYVPHWNVPISYNGKLAVTIHDLLWHEQKGTQATTLKPWLYALKHLAYLAISKQAAKKASVIFVPTQTIKETVEHYYPFAKDKIVISKEGIALEYELASKISNDNKRVKKQIVYTGSLYPHKNLEVVIKSLNKIPKYKLMVVCSRSIFKDKIKKLISRYKVKKQVSFLGYVPDKKLVKLYQESMALVQPSLSEGFGLTGIEAMASQTAVLASNIKVFKEIYQDAVFYFDPNSPEDFLRALEELELSNRKKILEKGLKIAKQYSFAKMSKEIWTELLKLL